jgi:hypothetical protein
MNVSKKIVAITAFSVTAKQMDKHTYTKIDRLDIQTDIQTDRQIDR